jgi:hypothetical protein
MDGKVVHNVIIYYVAQLTVEIQMHFCCAFSLVWGGDECILWLSFNQPKVAYIHIQRFV